MRNTAIFLLLAAVAQASCLGGEECYDCGDCGFAGGPNVADLIVLPAQGSSGGDAVVSLTVWREGECAGENSSAYWLVWTGGGFHMVADPQDTLDQTTVEYTAESYVWNDRDLTMTFTRQDDELLLDFVEAGVTTSVRCWLVSADLECAVQ